MSLLVVAHDAMTTYTMELTLNKLFPGFRIIRSDLQKGLPRNKAGSDEIRLIVSDLRSIAAPAELIRHLVQQFPAARMLGLIRSDCDEAHQMALSLKSTFGRPHGFVPSSVGPEILAAAVHLVAEGGEIVLWDQGTNKRTARNGADGMEDGLDDAAEKAGATLQLVPHAWTNLHARYRLTAREEEVLAFLKTGMQNKMIAAQMSLSENTIRVHIHNVLRKLGVRNRTEAVNAIYNATTNH